MTIFDAEKPIAGPRIGTVSRTLREGCQALLKSVLLLAGFLEIGISAVRFFI
jgi:hypothetical protein